MIELETDHQEFTGRIAGRWADCETRSMDSIRQRCRDRDGVKSDPAKHRPGYAVWRFGMADGYCDPAWPGIDFAAARTTTVGLR